MLPILLHWYLIFSSFWSAQPREAFVKNGVKSYTVWLSRDNGAQKREKRVEFNSHGDVMAIYRYSGTEVSLVDTFVYTYTAANKILTLLHEDVKTTYSYNPDGTVSRREEVSTESNIPERHTLYVYDKSGRLQESRAQHEDEDAPYLVKKYEYNAADSSIKEVRYSEGRLFETTYYYFNSAGQLTRLESIVNGGAGKVTTLYQYNDKGLLASESLNTPGKVNETRTYEYTY